MSTAVQTWKWTTDGLGEVDKLNEFGAQGWEVERIDGLLFVSRRPADRTHLWQYRRESSAFKGGRARAERLAAQGWQPCGTWIFQAYWKRPTTAEPVETGALPGVPERNLYWSRRLGVCVLAWLVAAVALGAVVLAPEFPGSGALTGFLTGLLVVGGGLVAGAVLVWAAARRAVARGRA